MCSQHASPIPKNSILSDLFSIKCKFLTQEASPTSNSEYLTQHTASQLPYSLDLSALASPTFSYTPTHTQSLFLSISPLPITVPPMGIIFLLLLQLGKYFLFSFPSLILYSLQDLILKSPPGSFF